MKPREVRPGERPAEGGFQGRIAEIRRFFDCPDGVHDWAQWLRMVLEDLAVIDAVSLYRRRDRLGRLAALEPLDGATIKVLLDASGRRPMAPDPAYQQILKGIPAVDYSADELLYYPRNPRTNYAYGYSPVEQIIRLAETAIERLGSQRAYFTQGNVSDGIFTGPAGWQTDQIKAWQGYWDALFAGNVEQRRAGWWVPAGTQYQALKQPALKDEFDEWLARLICFAFSTSPTPFVKAQNRATAETQQQTAEEGGLAPIMAYVKRLVDRVIATDLGCPDLEFVWSEDREFDPMTAARIDDLALRNGSRTVNEVRDRLGLDTLPGGDQPMVLTPTGYVPLTPQPLGKGYFIEDQHPRQPLGSPGGIRGQFAPTEGGDAAPAPSGNDVEDNQYTGGARLQLVAGGGVEGGDEESSGLRSRRDGLLEELLDPGAALRVERYSETFADLQRLSPGGLNGPTLSDPNFIPNQEDIEKLEEDLTARQKTVSSLIANGHAYRRHVLERGEFPGVNGQAELENVVDFVLKNPTTVRDLSRGRTAFYYQPTNTLVVVDPNSQDCGRSCPRWWCRSAGSLVIYGWFGRMCHAGTADSKTMGLSLTVATDSRVI